MTTSTKAKATKPATAKAIKPKAAKATKPVIVKTKQATITTGTAASVATAVSEAAAEKQKLNAAFLVKAPGLRSVFQSKFKPLNLAAHKPQHASDRDEAFIYAIKTVYADKPFTHKQTGADSGNLARAINLGRITPCGERDGEPLYKLA